MRRFVLIICLLFVAAPFAAAHNPPPKHKGHAPEMPGAAMATAGVISLGGYLFIRRRASLARQK